MTATADITFTTVDGTTYVYRDDLGILAASFFVVDGTYTVHRYVSPDDYRVTICWGRDAAKRCAIDHAASL